VGLLPAAIAAASAEGREPGYALNSLWVYRLQVGVAFFVGVYLVVITLWLAYQGRSFGKIGVPGGPELDVPDPNLEQAAEGFDEFVEDATTRLGHHDDSLEDLDDRLRRLERREEDLHADPR
jgi:hypothetical protein